MANLMIDGAARLGEQLLKEGTITPDQLAEALSQQQTAGGRIGAVLVEAGRTP